MSKTFNLVMSKADLRHCLKNADPAKAIGEFFIDDSTTLNEQCLEHLCSMGGWPDEPEYSLSDYIIADGQAVISYRVYFNEEFPGSCSDTTSSRHQTGEVELRVDLETGKVSYQAYPFDPIM